MRVRAGASPDVRAAVAAFVCVTALAALSCVTAVGCGQTVVLPKEPEKCNLQVVNFAIMASPRLNPSESGEARPVQLRIYQLANEVQFNNASFEKIWKDDKATLGADLIKVEETSVYPDSRIDTRFERDEKALVVVVAALFRNPRGRTWYTAFELPPAPGKGECGLLECDGGACKPKDQKAKLSPQFYVWLDGYRVDDGEDRLEEYPAAGRRRPVVVGAERETGPASP
jgi:type VI secretion system protein VasD